MLADMSQSLALVLNPCLMSQHVTSHPGQLSLAIPPWVGGMKSLGLVRSALVNVMLCCYCSYGTWENHLGM